jgi:O6-methylguanine-DNA--protein-cysteine methyltransferase
LTPDDYRRDDLTLGFGFRDSPFGETIVVAAPRGLAGLGFVDEGKREAALADMQRRWPRAKFVANPDATAPYVARAFDPNQWRPETPLRIVLIGTDFELRVWETLLTVPMARATTYSDIARRIGAESRARRRRRGRPQSDLLRRPQSSRIGSLGRADRLPLGARAKAGDHRLGGRAGLNSGARPPSQPCGWAANFIARTSRPWGDRPHRR